MRKLLTTLCAGALAVGTAIVGIAPTNAAPFVPAPTVEKATDLQNVQYRRYPRDEWGNRRVRGWEGRRDWEGRRNYRRGYHNGYRGYRDYRPGYRRHGDFWFPAGAFIAGALIGGALSDGGPRYAEPRRVYRGGGNAHVQWCYDRYRSYRAYDNTFQPYNGPRQQCYSPYR